jgi:hypothetical protein
MPGERCRITRLKRRPSESFAFALFALARHSVIL